MITIEEDWKPIYGHDSFEKFQNLSSKDKRIHHLIDGGCLPMKEEVKVYRKEKNIIVAVRTVSWKFARNRFFPKSHCKIVATVTPKRIFSDNIIEAGRCLSRYLGFSITVPINRIVFRQILNRGKEAYDEFLEQNHHGLCLPGPVTDIKIFVEGDIKEFAERLKVNHELRDLYDQAVALDKKIKLSWSDRKIHDLHMKWTEEIHKIKCRNCSTKLIWENIPPLPKEVELLNSEMRIAEEGHKMHHCIYTNYLNLLERKAKIAFHANDFTVMFDVDINGCKLNQAYKAWNKPLSEEEMDFAKCLVAIADNIVTLNVENIAPTQNYNTYQHNGVIDDDFAF